MKHLRTALVAVAFLATACPSKTTTGQAGGSTSGTSTPERPLSPAEADALFDQAEQAFAARDWAKARDAYRTLLVQFPLFPRGDLAKYHLGLAQLELKEFRDAVQTLSPLYDRLPAADKPATAQALAQASVGTHQWAEAVRFLAEAGKDAQGEAKAKLDAQLYELVDGQVPQLEIARLAQELKPDSPAYALVQFKLARIAFHLHNWDLLRSTLQTLQQNAPGNPFNAEASRMLERVNKRDHVKPSAVGVLLPLSGKYQRFGEDALSGIKLALEGAKDIQLVVKDTTGDPVKAKEVVEQLVLDEQVVAIIGPVVTTEATAAATASDELGAPIVVLSREEGITQLGPYVFRNMLTNSAQAKALVDYATQVRGFKTFGVLYPNIPYGTELANFFWDDVLAANGEVNGAETYDHDQTTFGPTVKKLVGRAYLEDRSDYLKSRREITESIKDPYKQKKALEKLRSGLEPVIDFEALFIPDQQKNVGLIAPALAVEDVITNGCDTRDMERIAKTMGLKNAKDVKSVLLLGANGWDSPDLVERGGKFVQCSVFVDGFYAASRREKTQAFVKAYGDANSGKTPSLLSAYGYDTGSLVKQVLQKDKPQTRDAFREALSKVKNFPGATGNISIRNNEAERPLFFMTIDRNGIKELDVQPGAGKTSG